MPGSFRDYHRQFPAAARENLMKARALWIAAEAVLVIGKNATFLVTTYEGTHGPLVERIGAGHLQGMPK
jgi:hypothetical protein